MRFPVGNDPPESEGLLALHPPLPPLGVQLVAFATGDHVSVEADPEAIDAGDAEKTNEGGRISTVIERVTLPPVQDKV